MKKFLLSMIAICAISFTQNVFGQCTPDPSIKTSGTFPASLNEAKVGEAYEQVIQYFITKDTTVFVPQLGQTVNATIDTLRILNVLGMPSGFTYTCHNADCKIVGGTGGCAKLIGTPKSGSAGIYPLVVLIGIRATAYLGPLPVGQNVTDSNARYSITVNPASGNMEINAGEDLVIYPNPAKSSVQFYLPNFKGTTMVSIYDMKGQKMTNQAFNLHLSTGEISIEGLKEGVYRLVMQTEQGVFGKTFIKE